MNTTDQFSFILRPSTIDGGGVGVFALHDIAKDTVLELFSPNFEEEVYSIEDVPEALRGYCIDREDSKISCPKYFNCMDIVNYLNHSVERQNIQFTGGKRYVSLRDIKEGEELFANYNELGEPEETKEAYYNQ